MKKLIPFLLLIVACSKQDLPSVSQEQEITLYNQAGKATAYYVVEGEQEATVYRWTGEPPHTLVRIKSSCMAIMGSL